MNKSALDRFFLNTSTATERAEVISWMLDPTNDETLKAWMKDNWDMLGSITGSSAEEPDVELIWGRLQLNLQHEVAALIPPAVVPVKANRRIYHYLAAACLVAALLTGGYFLYRPAARDNGLSAYGNAVMHAENKTAVSKRIVLEDGSVVVLSANAVLDYPAHFTTDKREVALTGEAFFDVQKNAESPFLIYANSIVTKVLGTSFTIQSNPDNGDPTVAVHTGRVQVLERKATEQKGLASKNNNGVILTANQKAVYHVDKKDFQTTLVDTPLLVQTAGVAKPLFEFKRTPLPAVMSVLEKAYGIEIILESERLNTCLFWGDITDENLYEKLDLICRSVNAVYEISGTRILIKGDGCR